MKLNAWSIMSVLAVFLSSQRLCQANLFEHDNVIALTDPVEQTADGKLYAIKFFTPWCGHCKRLSPTWGDLALKYKGSDSIRVAQVDCVAQKDACTAAKISGYPTIKAYYQGQEVGTHTGARSLEALTEFVEEQMRDATTETTS